jgi:predicted ester cyclase
MSPEQNKRAYHRLIEVGFNRGDSATLNALLAPGFVVHGHEVTLAVATACRSALPDLQLSIAEQLAEGDLVASRWTAWGTHRGAMLGIPPTGRSIALTGMSIVRFVDGRLVEEWLEIDIAGLLQQLGHWPLAPVKTAS